MLQLTTSAYAYITFYTEFNIQNKKSPKINKQFYEWIVVFLWKVSPYDLVLIFFENTKYYFIAVILWIYSENELQKGWNSLLTGAPGAFKI